MSSYDRIFCSSASLISNRRLYAGGTKHLVGCIESSSSGEGRGGGCKGMRSNYKTSCKQKKVCQLLSRYSFFCCTVSPIVC